MWSASAGKHGVVAAAIALVTSFDTPAIAGVRYSVEIGANTSSLRYRDLNVFPPITSHWDPGWRTSFAGGASLEAPLRRRFSLMTGLRYVQQGNRVKINIPGSPPLTGEIRIAQHYLAVPLLLAIRPTPSRRCFLAAGPEGAFLLSGRSFTDYSSPVESSSSESITHQLKRANLSLDAEGGLEFLVGRHTGIVILRYTHGLIDVQKQDDWIVAWKTRGVESLVGMRW